MSNNNLVRTAGLTALLLFYLTVYGQESTTSQMAGGEETTYTFTGESLEGPTQLPAGFRIITLQNDVEGASLDITLFRITGDATVEDVAAAFAAVDQAFGGGNPVEAINEVSEMGELWGGPATESGMRSSVGIDLPEGRYAVVGTVHQHGQGQEGPPAPARYVTTTLDVTPAAEATEAPQADVTVQMVDFAFTLPAGIQAGPQMWEVVNRGEQLHHLVLARLQEGKTMEDLQTFMQGGEQGPPPVDQVGQTNILSSGVSNYITLDLTPGTYLTLCLIPDHHGDATGAPHVALGMMQTFLIEGNP